MTFRVEYKTFADKLESLYQVYYGSGRSKIDMIKELRFYSDKMPLKVCKDICDWYVDYRAVECSLQLDGYPYDAECKILNFANRDATELSFDVASLGDILNSTEKTKYFVLVKKDDFGHDVYSASSIKEARRVSQFLTESLGLIVTITQEMI